MKIPCEFIIKIIIGVMLFSCGVQDIKSKKISTWIIISGMILLVICIPFCGSLLIFDRVGGILVGGVMLLVSKATGGKFGIGDSLMLCATGLGLGLWGNLEVFSYGLFLAAVISIILLIFRVVNRKKSIPFIPFLFAGYIGSLILG